VLLKPAHESEVTKDIINQQQDKTQDIKNGKNAVVVKPSKGFLFLSPIIMLHPKQHYFTHTHSRSKNMGSSQGQKKEGIAPPQSSGRATIHFRYKSVVSPHPHTHTHTHPHYSQTKKVCT